MRIESLQPTNIYAINILSFTEKNNGMCKATSPQTRVSKISTTSLYDLSGKLYSFVDYTRVL